MDSTCPSFLDKVNDARYLQERTILVPTNQIVEIVIEYMLSLFPGEIRTYLSCDSICPVDTVIDYPDDLYILDFLNILIAYGLPNHALKLKIGSQDLKLWDLDRRRDKRNTCQESIFNNWIKVIYILINVNIIYFHIFS